MYRLYSIELRYGLLATALLVPGLATAGVELASVPAYADLIPSNGASANAKGSSDLGVLVFDSAASNLVGNDQNTYRDVFVRDSQGVSLISRNAGQSGNGDSTAPDLSADGDWVVFTSTASNLVAGDTNEVADLFVYRRSNGQLTRLSPAGGQANGASFAPRMSASGQRIVFVSAATNWVSSDQNGLSDVFVYDLGTQQVTRVAQRWDSGEVSDFAPRNPQITADGQCVSLESQSAQLVPNDTNQATDYFIVNVDNGSTTRATLGSGNRQIRGATPNRHALLDCASLVFHTLGTDVLNGFPASGFFLSQNGSPSLLAIDDPGFDATATLALSRNASQLVFGSESANGFGVYQQRLDLVNMQVSSSTTDYGAPQAIADNGQSVVTTTLRPVAPPDRNVQNDLLLRQANPVFQRWISQASPSQAATLVANGASSVGLGLYQNDQLLRRRHHALSADGRYVLFSSEASNLVLGDSNGVEDVFLRDRLLNLTVRVNQTNLGAESTQASAASDISADGRMVLFESCDDLGVVSSPGVCDLFVRNMATGVTLPVSVSSAGQPANQGGSTASGHWGRISSDGRYVTFVSRASNLTPGQNTVSQRVYLRDLVLATTTFLGSGSRPSISRNGRYVVWISFDQIMFLDREAGTPMALPYNTGTAPDEFTLDWPTVSDSGRYVAYATSTNGLVVNDQDSATDVFVFDRVTGTNTLISTPAVVSPTVAGGAIPEISPDGRLVAFLSENLPGPAHIQGYLVDWQNGTHGTFAGADLASPERVQLSRPRFSADGNHVVFAASHLDRSAVDQSGDLFDVFVTTTEINRLFANSFE